MSDAIVYCERCGRIIMPSDIEHGDCVKLGDAFLCAECFETLPPEQRKALATASSRGASRTAESGPRRAPPPPRKGAPGLARAATPAPRPRIGPKIAAIACIGLGAAAAIAAAILVRPGEQGAPVPRFPPVPPAHSAGPRPPEPGGPGASPAAAKELARLRGMVDAQLSHYDEIVRGLRGFPERFPGAGELAEAKALLEQVERDYAALAEGALADAHRAAEELAARGEFDSALSQFRLVEARFRGSAWFDASGGKRIADAMAAIEARRGTSPPGGAARRPDRWWRFDEGSGATVFDSSGNGVDGRLVNMDASAWTEGVSGRALRFDGVDDYVSIPDNRLPAPRYYDDGDFTIAFWVKLLSDRAMSLVRRSTEDAAWWADGRTLHVKKAGTGPMYLEGFVWDGTPEFATGTTPLRTGTWYHVAMVADCGGGAKALRVYLNGSPEGSAWFGVPGGWPQDSWFIGRDLSGKGYAPLHGIVDDVRVFNTALADQEVAGLYREMSARPGAAPGGRD